MLRHNAGFPKRAVKCNSHPWFSWTVSSFVYGQHPLQPLSVKRTQALLTVKTAMIANTTLSWGQSVQDGLSRWVLMQPRRQMYYWSFPFHKGGNCSKEADQFCQGPTAGLMVGSIFELGQPQLRITEHHRTVRLFSKSGIWRNLSVKKDNLNFCSSATCVLKGNFLL